MSSLIDKKLCVVDLHGSFWAGTYFSDGVLSMRESLSVTESLDSPPKSFIEYLTHELLGPQHRSSKTCHDSWAFSVSAALQCATALAYQRMGLRFTNRYMSSEYLLSCYEVGPTHLCGCLGADLPMVMQHVSQEGLVTFDQFPYVTSVDVDMNPDLDMDLVYFCKKGGHLGTCAPCEDTLNNYVENIASASPKISSYHYTVPCLPCVQPTVPKYFLKEPFQVASASKNRPFMQAIAIQKELVRTGPLCVALAVDGDAFTALVSGRSPPTVSNASDGLFYKPRRIQDTRAFHTALLVGYAHSASGPPFWICRGHIGASDFGYTLRIAEKTVDGLFNVDMYDSVSQILERVVSFEEVFVLTKPDGFPHSLRRDDPFVLPQSKNIGLNSPRGPSFQEDLTKYPRAVRYKHFFFALSIVALILVSFTVIVMI